MPIVRMTNLDLRGKRVLIREDLNVPLKDGKVAASQRLEAALPTIKLARDAGARVLLMSHLGRPKEGHFSESESLAPIAHWLGNALGKPVPLLRKYLDGETIDVGPGEVVLLENCRFNVGEEKDDATLAERYAMLCEIFVMDASARRTAPGSRTA
jgi:phosphoglycerate kinase